MTVLGPWESDPNRQIVSYDSDLGQSLLGRGVGESVDIEDTVWKITGIATWD